MESSALKNEYFLSENKIEIFQSETGKSHRDHKKKGCG